MRFVALVDRAEDGSHGVVFPDARGCTAMGETLDEALSNGADALADWAADEFEAGRSLPVRSAEEILSDERVKRAIAGGAILVSVPLLRARGKLARVNISVDDGLLADIDEAATALGVTRSAFLASAARDKIRSTAGLPSAGSADR
ncbi:MAG: type II toxin-antitoxin system HicB family antitoxin [Bauldia sp.]|nr:type II toxin-antitoxin system HicB family antitoxin [Bauldia sp.]